MCGHAGEAVPGAAPAASPLPACSRAPSCATCPPARLPQAEGGGEAAPAASPLAPGTWRLVWTQQGETANPLQRALANQVENFQVISEDGRRLENLVRPAPGLRVRAAAAAGPEAGPLGASSRTSVEIDEVVLEAGPLRLPLPVKTDGRGFVEW